MKKIALLIFLYSVTFAAEQNGTFIDTKHHLEWQDTPHVEEEESKWSMSKAYCRSLKLSGNGDWRLPSISELKTVIDVVRFPTKDRKFKYGEKSGYWTSEEDKGDDVNAWAIYMSKGHLFSNDKCETAYIRCVRDKR